MKIFYLFLHELEGFHLLCVRFMLHFLSLQCLVKFVAQSWNFDNSVQHLQIRCIGRLLGKKSLVELLRNLNLLYQRFDCRVLKMNQLIKILFCMLFLLLKLFFILRFSLDLAFFKRFDFCFGLHNFLHKVLCVDSILKHLYVPCNE